MGDHAEQLFDDYLAGLGNEDGWDDESPEPKTCRHCQTGNLHWGQVGEKWRLFGPDDKIHVCAVKPLADPVSFVRAAGECVCSCGKTYYKHPMAGPLFEGHRWLHRLCDGSLVKL